MPRAAQAKRWSITAFLVAVAIAWPGTTPGYVHVAGTDDIVMGDVALCAPAATHRVIERAPCIAAVPLALLVESGVRLSWREANIRLSTVRVVGAPGARAPPPSAP